MRKNYRKPNFWQGMMTGLIAGLAASWTMDRFQDFWLTISSGDDLTNTDEANARDEAASFKSEPGKQSRNDESQDDATVKAAAAVSEAVFRHKLTAPEKRVAGPAVHYAVGATSGIVYCVAAEYLPAVTTAFGLPYGTAFWLVVDEGGVPLLRLSKPPTAYPLSTHIYALASHLVFGATAEGVRRLLRG